MVSLGKGSSRNGAHQYSRQFFTLPGSTWLEICVAWEVNTALSLDEKPFPFTVE